MDTDLMELQPNDNQEFGGALSLLRELIESVKNSAKMHELQCAIMMLEGLLNEKTGVDEHRVMVQRSLISALLTRFGIFGWIWDLRACDPLLACFSAPKNLTSGAMDDGNDEVQLAIQLIQECRTSLDITTIDTIVCIAEEAISSSAKDVSTLQNADIRLLLGRALVMRFIHQNGPMTLPTDLCPGPLDGFDQFLLPPSFSSLQLAAAGGPVVLLNATDSGADVLIVRGAGSVQHIALTDIRSKEVEALKMHIRASLAQRSTSMGDATGITQELETVLPRDMIREDEKETNRSNDFRCALGILWVKVAKPIIEFLGLVKTECPTRVWWCLTGPFTSLPIHAAGIYSDDDKPDLLHPSPRLSQDFKIMAIIEPEALGGAHLPATVNELDNIERHAPDPRNLIARLGLRTAPNQIDEILTDIQQSSFVHFGCHGMQNLTDPLESSLLLSGGRLTMKKIIKECKVREGAFAYLSACETAKGDEGRPNESLNLVATMMFGGFRSVVGTLWSIFDNDAPVVADVVYGHLFRNGNNAPPDVRDAAYGLHLATKELRDRGRPFCSWVPYVHYGI